MPFRAEKAGNRPKAAIKRTRRPNYTTPIFSMSDREQDFYRFLQNPPPLRGGGATTGALGVDTRAGSTWISMAVAGIQVDNSLQECPHLGDGKRHLMTLRQLPIPSFRDQRPEMPAILQT